MRQTDSKSDWDDATRHYALRADAMYVATAALAESLDLNKVLDTLLFYLQSLVPYDSANVMLLKDESHLIIRALRGYEQWIAPFNIDDIRNFIPSLHENPVLRTALTKSILIDDTKSYPDWQEIPQLNYIHNWIGVPLMVEGKPIGIYSLDKATTGFFTKEHVQMAEMMAAPAAAAIRNASLFAQVQEQTKLLERRVSRGKKDLSRQYDRQSALANIKIALHQPQELYAVLERVVQAATSLMPSTDASIVLWDISTESFVESATTTRNQAPDMPAKQVRQQGGATRWIVDNQQPLVVPDVQLDQFGANKMLADYGYQAYVGVPLLTGDTCLGVIYALDKEKHAYQSADVAFLQALANQAAAAIDNVQLFQKLKTNEARLNSVISHAPVLLFVLDIEGVVTFAKGKALEFLGFSSETAVGQKIQDLFSNFPQIIEDAQKALSGKKVRTSTEIMGFTWDIKYASFYDEFAKIDSIIGVATDITELKQAEKLRIKLFKQTQKALIRTEALYRVAQSLVVVSDIIALLQSIVDNVTDILPANRTSLYIVNLQLKTVEDFVIGGPGANIDHVSTFADLQEGLTGWVLKNSKPALSLKESPDPRESPRIQQRRIAHRAGSIIVVPLQYREKILGTMTTIRQPEEPDFMDEDVALMVAIANQVAAAIQTAYLYQEVQFHIKELEHRVADRTQALTQANARLLEMGRLRTKFMHDVSHELRTPLTTFKLYLELMESGKADKQTKYLEVLRETSLRFEHLVEGVLHLSRLEIDKDKLTFSHVDLNQLVTDAFLSTFEERANVANIALEFEPSSSPATVWADKVQLGEAINCLLINAITYTHEGKVKAQILPDVETNQVILEISDTGIGIDAEDMPHIFEPFYRGKQVGQSTIPGMGIGLTMVRGILNLHHGEISFESELGVGTTFKVKLPIQAA